MTASDSKNVCGRCVVSLYIKSNRRLTGINNTPGRGKRRMGNAKTIFYRSCKVCDTHACSTWCSHTYLTLWIYEITVPLNRVITSPLHRKIKNLTRYLIWLSKQKKKKKIRRKGGKNKIARRNRYKVIPCVNNTSLNIALLYILRNNANIFAISNRRAVNDRRCVKVTGVHVSHCCARQGGYEPAGPRTR